MPQAIEWSFATPMINPRFPCIKAVMLDSQTRKNCFAGLLGGDDGDHLEIDEIAPVRDPLLKQACVVAFHDLEAAIEIHLDPARDVFETVGRHPALIAEAPVDRFGVAVAEPLDHHELHRQASRRLNTRVALVPPKPNEFDSTAPILALSMRLRTIGMSANTGSSSVILALSQIKPLFIISSE